MSDVDAEFECGGADRRCRRGTSFERGLRLLAQFARQAAMVRPEFIPHAFSFGAMTEPIRVFLNLRTAIWKDQVIRSAQVRVQVIDYCQLRGTRHLLLWRFVRARR